MTFSPVALASTHGHEALCSPSASAGASIMSAVLPQTTDRKSPCQARQRTSAVCIMQMRELRFRQPVSAVEQRAMMFVTDLL
jgi:hypothetical protein